ncbi:MAG: FixH family protein [Bellilinea sp.]
MRKLMLDIGFLFAIALLLTACSSGATPENSASTGTVNIQVDSDPNPAMMGDATLTLVITDENGNPIEGARVDVSMDHTDMTGMVMSGLATDQGDGKYAINANFSMSGNWKMTVYVRKDSLDYKEDIELTIQ